MEFTASSSMQASGILENGHTMCRIPFREIVLGLLLDFIRGRTLDPRTPSDCASGTAQYEMGSVTSTKP